MLFSWSRLGTVSVLLLFGSLMTLSLLFELQEWKFSDVVITSFGFLFLYAVVSMLLVFKPDSDDSINSTNEKYIVGLSSGLLFTIIFGCVLYEQTIL